MPRKLKIMKEPICESSEYKNVVDKIDALIARVKRFQKPELKVELDIRENASPNFDLKNDEFLRLIATLITYSQQVPAKSVGKLIDSGFIDKVFHGFSVEEVAELNGSEVREKFWIKKSNNPTVKNTLTAIRYPQKIDSIISCAEVLQKIQAKEGLTFARYIQGQDIPRRISNEKELDLFWEKFVVVQNRLNDWGMPFLNRLTTLCHLLKDMGYDCAKPDSAVMNAAVKLDIIKRKKTWTDNDRKKVIRIMQIYGICRGVRPPVLDLYFLIHGEQTGAIDLVQAGYF